MGVSRHLNFTAGPWGSTSWGSGGKALENLGLVMPEW